MSQSFPEFLRQFITDERLARFDEVLSHRTRHITAVLENVFHEHNASACLRTCDCFGIQDVHIIESKNSFSPNSEISLGSSQWLTLHRHGEPAESVDATPEELTLQTITELKNSGYRVLATSPRQNSLPMEQVDLSRPVAVIFGAEQVGVSETAIENADELIHIPMFGFTESFNISVSLALLMQHFTARLRQSDTDWQLPEDARAALHHDWVCQTLGQKLEPLRRRFEADSA